jgi:hypothetical protein
MSVRAYSRARNAKRKSVQRATAAGVIKLDDNGQIDVAQADAAWGSVPAAGRRHITSEADANASTVSAGSSPSK